MSASRPLASVIAASILCMSLAACAPSQPDVETPSPTPVATSTPEPTEEPVSWFTPESRLGLDCATLVDPALVAAALPGGAEVVDPLVTATGVGIAIPRRTSIISLGGDVCEWSNGAPVNDQYGANPDYSGIAVMVLVEPDGGWSESAVEFAMPSDERYCGPASCNMSAAVGDVWVTLDAEGTIDAAGTDALFTAVVSEVAAVGTPRARTVPERDRPALPTDCEQVLPLDTVRSVSGLPDAVLAGGGGGWSVDSEAKLAAGDFGCRWSVSETESAAADVGWVRDGRWAYERALAAGTFEPATIAGLGPDDLASVRCDVDFGGSCAVDMAFGPDWINVAGRDRATAIALAEAVVANLG